MLEQVKYILQEKIGITKCWQGCEATVISINCGRNLKYYSHFESLEALQS
jgi:hypothetical protein